MRTILLLCFKICIQGAAPQLLVFEKRLKDDSEYLPIGACSGIGLKRTIITTVQGHAFDDEEDTRVNLLVADKTITEIQIPGIKKELTTTHKWELLESEDDRVKYFTELFTHEDGVRSLQKYNDAAKMIETEGPDGFRRAAKIVGDAAATVLLVTHFRRELGSMEGYPPNPDIDGKAIAIVQEIKKQYVEL